MYNVSLSVPKQEVNHMANAQKPLAEQLRPQAIEEVVGQVHIIGEGKPLSLALAQGRMNSMIFWGPPGVGKTTLATIIANQMQLPFYALSAVSAGKADVRKIVEQISQGGAGRTLFDMDADKPKSAILFLDEIHRFNKAQQDFLLPYVEDGTLVLIGATTENPSFEVNAALLSRMQVIVLHELQPEDILIILQRGLNLLDVQMDEDALVYLSQFANGDGRTAINILETVAMLHGGQVMTIEHIKETIQNGHLRYDKGGEEHYNTISAFIKSMRASNVDAALYYLARMIDAGEDPKFIARRMVIFASEDIGMALPTALVVANEVFRAVETVGLPEAQINLAHGVTYLASAPKDRSSYDAYFRALDDVKAHRNLPIPMSLRNAPTSLMKNQGYGKGYELYPDPNINLLPDALKGKRYYKPDGE